MANFASDSREMVAEEETVGERRGGDEGQGRCEAVEGASPPRRTRSGGGQRGTGDERCCGGGGDSAVGS
jgi:hypothetical protein